MLIITGLGRCGSSVLTLMVEALGYGTGAQRSYDKSLRAGMEFAPAYAISRDLYDDFISKEREIDLDEEIDTPYWGKISYRNRILRVDKDDVPGRNQGKVEVIKDPRITWHPDILKSWWEVRKDLSLIFLHRDPEEIIASRNLVMREDSNWDNFYDPKRGENLDEFKKDLEMFMEALSSVGIKYEELNYPDFLLDLSQSYNALSSLGYVGGKSLNECINIWKGIVDLSLVHDFKKPKNSSLDVSRKEKKSWEKNALTLAPSIYTKRLPGGKPGLYYSPGHSDGPDGGS